MDAPRVASAAFGRLTRRADFQRVSRGRRKSSAAFVLQSAPREDGGPGEPKPRVGFTVTRKVGGAVARNRIRRRLREALKAALPLETESDCDYVLMARREALSRDFAELVDDMRNAFRAAARDRRGSRGGPSAPRRRTELK
ncbi:MAG: ribonuclease P protein component [Hyphomicrobiales bacterium]|nr:ribonuclease P protein component [Hyphomicrobiales bacterium]